MAFNSLSNKFWLRGRQGAGGGGVLGFRVTGMIEWGRKEKPRKIPEPKIYRLNQSHAEFLKFPLNIKLMM